MLSGGIIYSKLVYCLAVIRNISGMQNYREGARMAGMTADDCNKLQVIQNSLNRLLTCARKGTPTKDLLERKGTMSIMQMVAYHILDARCDGQLPQANWQEEELVRSFYELVHV